VPLSISNVGRLLRAIADQACSRPNPSLSALATVDYRSRNTTNVSPSTRQHIACQEVSCDPPNLGVISETFRLNKLLCRLCFRWSQQFESASSNLKCITLAQNGFRHLRRSLGHLILYVLVAARLVGSSSVIIDPMTEAVLSG